MWHTVVATVLALGTLAGSLMTHQVEIEWNVSIGARDLVLMHLPFNFGNTVAKVAALGNNVDLKDYLAGLQIVNDPNTTQAWEGIRALAQEDPEFWATMNPDIQIKSSETNFECPMFYTPQKYWPPDLAKKYFGSHSVFGLIRNPYDRLVAIFRGNRGIYGEYFPSASNNHTCDVNGAVRRMIDEYNAGNRFAQQCRFLPQVEFFEGAYGVTIPVDIHDFPVSANNVLASHGYDNVHITSEDEITVSNVSPGECDHIWGGDLDAKTKKMVKDVYMKDFELLCQEFDYCDFDEANCLRRSEGMCPDKAFTWNATAVLYTPCEDYDCGSQG